MKILLSVFLYYFFNLIKIAIANKINKNPIAIKRMLKILFNPKFASGRPDKVFTAVTFELPFVFEFVDEFVLVTESALDCEAVLESDIVFSFEVESSSILFSLIELFISDCCIGSVKVSVLFGANSVAKQVHNAKQIKIDVKNKIFKY